MISLAKPEKEHLIACAEVQSKRFFVSGGAALEENFGFVASVPERNSVLGPYDDWGKRLHSLGNALDALDFENRLIRRTSGTKTINISYDADGNRVSKTVSDSTSGTTTTYYLVDTNNLTGYAQVFEELYNNGGNLETYRSYTYGLDLIAQHQLMPPANPTQWETSYYMYDGLGTVRALTDDNGLITDAYTYSAFGELLNAQSSGTATPNAYLYTGEQYDSDLGMYHLRARYMNPITGRFHNLDTFEGSGLNPLSLHKYLYAHANPITWIDPSGNAVSLAEVQLAMVIVGTLNGLAIGSARSAVNQARDIFTPSGDIQEAISYLNAALVVGEIASFGVAIVGAVGLAGKLISKLPSVFKTLRGQDPKDVQRWAYMLTRRQVAEGASSASRPRVQLDSTGGIPNEEVIPVWAYDSDLGKNKIIGEIKGQDIEWGGWINPQGVSVDAAQSNGQAIGAASGKAELMTKLRQIAKGKQ